MPASKIISLIIAIFLIGIGQSSPAAESHSTDQKKDLLVNSQQKISRTYALSIAQQVNEKVSKNFFDANMVNGAWKEAYKALETYLREEGDSLTMSGLSSQTNKALQSLKSSHCQFVTSNDETFYFLHSLFATVSRDISKGPHSWARPIACTGMATGGCNFDFDQVRYVLDRSPADRAGLQIGDKILSVSGRPYSGYLDFMGQEDRALQLKIKRGSEEKTVILKPVKKHIYRTYAEATRASMGKYTRGKHTFGYVHLWSGGSACTREVDDLLTNDLKDVDGLIYDLRDGYGGASFNDLDVFYRQPADYPDMLVSGRDNHNFRMRLYFDKPVVLLINSGSRSGKELLAYSLKSSDRALLVGDKTAGAVLAGSLYPIDQKCALYLAVSDIKLVSHKNKETVETRLEGQGVAPDITVINTSHDQNGYGLQLKAAIDALEKRLSDQN